MLHNALRGVKVLDLSRILAGPWCTQNLADMGAEVIKVEQPGSGDDTRGWGPPDQTSPDGQASMSAYFMACNRGKQSIELGFSWPDGAQTVRRLAAEADILVENFKAAGQPGGMPGAGPLRAGVAVVDLMTGMYATSAVLAALRQRDQTGQGLPLDICLLDVAVALNANQGANYLVSGKAPQRTGNAHPNCAPYEVFACADGHLILAIGNDGQFARFCKVVGHPEWAGDARYATNSARLEHMPTLRPMLAAALAGAPRQAWTDAFDAAGVPWGPIHTLDEVFAHPQVRHRELLQTVRHPVLGEMRLVRNPLLAGAPAHALQACPPLLGEHSAAVLGHAAAAARAPEP